MGHKFVVSVGAGSNIWDIGAVMCIVWLAVVGCTCSVAIVGVYGANSADV